MDVNKNPQMQRTLKTSVEFSGVGLHSGKMIQVEIRPAAANTGILFQRSDIPNAPYIKAAPESVFDTTLATRIGSPEMFISTVEHLMAAFFGLGIDNAVVAVSADEMPVLDGSSAPFLVMIDEAGIEELTTPRRVMIIKKAIEIVDPKNPTRFIRIEPSHTPRLSYAIDFENAGAIGKQSISFDLSGNAFCKELAHARTFCLAEDITRMQAAGLARGGSLDNAVVVSAEKGILNSEGLRSENEFVRHKALDCVGDLALLGMPIIGHIIANKAGHDLHTQMAKHLLAASLEQVEIVSAHQPEAIRLVGALHFPTSLFDELKDQLTSLVRG